MTVSHERKGPRTRGRRMAYLRTVMGQGGWHRVNEGKSKYEPRSKPGAIIQGLGVVRTLSALTEWRAAAQCHDLSYWTRLLWQTSEDPLGRGKDRGTPAIMISGMERVWIEAGE